MSEPSEPVTRAKRRSRRHSRNRLLRSWLLGTCAALVTIGASSLALKILSPSLFSSKPSAPPSFESSESSRDRVVTLNQMEAQPPSPARPVYAYSLIPGGVEDVNELKWVAEHDPIVGAHYAGFHYDRGRVVRLTLEQTAFVSYRIGNQVYFTRHRLVLHKGEKVITDGVIVVRGRCGNRVAQVPQQAAAPVEPPAVMFDQPMMEPSGTAMQAPPVPFQSAFLKGPSLGTQGPLALYDPGQGGSWVPIAAPPIPSGLCGPGKKKGTLNSGCCLGVQPPGKKNTGNGCGTGGEVPEPETWILFASGLIGVYWINRRRVLAA